MADDGKLKIGVLLDDKEFKSGLNKLGSTASSALTTTKNVAAGLVASAGAGISALGAIGLKYNAEMESYTTNFKVMLGSQEDAVKKVESLKKMAANTPFAMEDLASGTQTLLAFGIESSKTEETLKALGDVALGDKNKLAGLTLAFGQMSSTGKLMGQDLNQMINVGFNPLQEISKKTGKSMAELKDEMSKGAISAEMVANAFRSATSEGGQFYNGMEEASKTTKGLISTLKDNTIAKIGELFSEVSDILKTDLIPAALKFVASIDTKKVVDNVKKAVEVFQKLSPTIVGATVAAVAFKVAFGGLSIIATVVGLVKKFTAAQIGLNAVLMANPIGLVAGAVALLTGALVAATVAHKKQTEEAEKSYAALHTLRDSTLESAKAYEELTQAQDEQLIRDLSGIENTQRLANELSLLTDETGRVADGDRSRTNFIVNELNSALGLELEFINGVVTGNENLEESIRALIETKKAQIMLNNEEVLYKESLAEKQSAINEQAQAYMAIEEANLLIMERDNSLAELRAEYVKKYGENFEQMQGARMRFADGEKKINDNYASVPDALAAANEAYATSTANLEEHLGAISSYEEAYTAFLDKDNERAIAILENKRQVAEDSKLLDEEGFASEQELKAAQYEEALVQLDLANQRYSASSTQQNKDELDKAAIHANNCKAAYITVGSNMGDGIIAGIESRRAAVVATMVSVLAEVDNATRRFNQSNSPAKRYIKHGKNIDDGLAVGVADNIPTVKKAMNKMLTDTALKKPKAFIGSMFNGVSLGNTMRNSTSNQSYDYSKKTDVTQNFYNQTTSPFEAYRRALVYV